MNMFSGLKGQTSIQQPAAVAVQATVQQLRELADKVAIACKSPEAGVAVTVEYIPNGGYQFHIWSLAKHGLNRHCLWASVTDEARLLAHVSGFIANTRSAA